MEPCQFHVREFLRKVAAVWLLGTKLGISIREKSRGWELLHTHSLLRRAEQTKQPKQTKEKKTMRKLNALVVAVLMSALATGIAIADQEERDTQVEFEDKYINDGD